MGKSERDKGKSGEREVASIFTEAGLAADRTAALQAGSIPGAGDVTIRTLRDLHIEVKRTEAYSVPAWLRQVEDARLEGQDYVVAFRKSGKPRQPEPWRGIVDLVSYARLLAERERLRAFAARVIESSRALADDDARSIELGTLAALAAAL